jgi:uncharacterized protein DUF4124
MTRPTRSVAIAVALLAVVTGAGAQVYKCTDASGRTTYSDAPCDAVAKPLKLPPEPTKGSTTNPNVCAQLRDEMLRVAAEAEREAQKGHKENRASVARRQSLTRQYEARCAGISRSAPAKPAP